MQNDKIEQIIKNAEYAATSAIGDAVINISNYYYSEKSSTLSKSIEAVNVSPCPYRGLFHFGPNDSDVFFGRNKFITDLFKIIQTRKFTTVIGASGSGKSSVVLAGLVPKLQQEGHWKFTHFRPGSDPFHSLASALVPLYTSELDDTDQILQARKLADYLMDATISLSDVLATIQKNHINYKILLIADQFEELYTECIDNEIRRHFLNCLITNFQPSSTGILSSAVLITTLRTSFLGSALSYPPFADILQNSDIKLGTMNRSDLLQVIENPAKLLGVEFEEGLIERILDDVEDEPGNLPLLEFALTELWAKQIGKKMTHEAYEAIGKVKGAIADYADEKYNNLTVDDKKRAQRIFIQLVSPSNSSVDTRRLANRIELGEENWDLVIRRNGLADNRLVITNRNNFNQETVEVVHEALIKNWGKLSQWMETNREFRAWQERLRTDVYQWQKSAEDEDALLRGKTLLDAEEWFKERREEIGLEEQSYIIKSVELRKREKLAKERLRQRRTPYAPT